MASTRVVRADAPTRDARAAATTATKAARAHDARADRARAAARRARAVSFDAELERTIGVADARVDRGDVWELPRTCDRMRAVRTAGTRALVVRRCARLRGDAFDLCAGCRDAAARTARAARRRRRRRRRRERDRTEGAETETNGEEGGERDVRGARARAGGV